MREALIACERCGRHVFASAGECPFCRRKGLGTATAFVVTAGLALSACSTPAPAPAYGGPPPRLKDDAPVTATETPTAELPPLPTLAPPPTAAPLLTTAATSKPKASATPVQTTPIAAPAYGIAPSRKQPTPIIPAPAYGMPPVKPVDR